MLPKSFDNMFEKFESNWYIYNYFNFHIKERLHATNTEDKNNSTCMLGSKNRNCSSNLQMTSKVQVVF